MTRLQHLEKWFIADLENMFSLDFAILEVIELLIQYTNSVTSQI